jgi:hypothetical protein
MSRAIARAIAGMDALRPGRRVDAGDRRARRQRRTKSKLGGNATGRGVDGGSAHAAAAAQRRARCGSTSRRNIGTVTLPLPEVQDLRRGARTPAGASTCRTSW